MIDRALPASPLVSVIIPAYNVAPFLATAIASIHRQEYAPLQIILVDDGSTDETAAIAAQHQELLVLRQENRGPASARNRGLSAAKGELITFLDADDFWAPAMLPRLVAQLQMRPEIEIVQGLIQRVWAIWTDDGSGQRQIKFEPRFEPYVFINLGSAIYRRQVFEKVGLFDEWLADAEDTDWMIRAWEMQVDKLIIPEIFLYYWVRTDSLTVGGSRNKVTLMQLLKRHRDRVRNEQVAPSGRAGRAQRLHEFLGTAPSPHYASVVANGGLE
jgi:glycosyltransferase involved in cell wall biosynthesis